MAGLVKTKTYALKKMFHFGAQIGSFCNDTLFWLAKEALQYGTDDIKGGIASWEVLGSSDSSSANMTGTDLLDIPSKIVQATGNHSWIVLRQPLQGLAPNYLQVCFDWKNFLSYSMDFIFSIGAGFTGGTISARPTATDEVVVFTNTTVLDSTAQSGSCGVNCIKSTDGKVTRMILSRDGVLSTRAFWMFDELKDVESYWPSKSVLCIAPLTHIGVTGTSNVFTDQTGQHSGRMSWASITGNQLTHSGVGIGTLQKPDFGGAWPTFPCGMFIDLGANKGKLGNFHDFWSVPYTVPTGRYFAAHSGGDFEFVNIGGLVFPWNGTPMVLP